MIDPVCGMSVDPATSKHRFDYQGQTYYFCSASCRSKFAADPAPYLDPRKKKPAPVVPEGTIYTCPMHPEIRQIGPGTCPICGMALEPELVTLDDAPNPELVDMTRRFWIGLALTLPVFVLEMGAHLVGAHDWVDPTLSNWMQFALRHAGGAVGRLAVLRARRAVAAHAQPQHVHADRARHRRGLRLQRRRDARAAGLSARVPRP